MLVLTRKLLEKVYIGNDVCVTVVRIEGGQVRLGIEAPREVPVVRAELISGAEDDDDEPSVQHRGPIDQPPTAVDTRGQIRVRRVLAHGIGTRHPARSR